VKGNFPAVAQEFFSSKLKKAECDADGYRAPSTVSAESAWSKGTSVIVLAIAARKSRGQFNDPYLSSSALERDESESSISFASRDEAATLSRMRPLQRIICDEDSSAELSAPND